MLPKITFKYSYIYDHNWQEWFRVYKKTPQKLTPKQIQEYIKKIEKLWPKEEMAILQELARVSKLKWKKKEIICYVVSDCRPFSDPLTLPAYKNKEYFVDVLTHELIHQLFTQEGNHKKAKEAWEYFHKKYKKESFITRIHIPLYAIHSHVYKKLFNEERMERDMHWIKFFPDYKKAWEIVKKEGYKKVLKEFNSRIKK
jgi:hypothetical protein